MPDNRSITKSDVGSRWSEDDLVCRVTVTVPEKIEISFEDEFPDGGLRAWLVVFGCICGSFATFGYLNAWGVFQSYYEENLLKSSPPSSVAWIGSIQNSLIFAPGLITGRLFDMGHLRLPILLASSLLVLSTFLIAQCTQYWHFLICQGFATGLACGVIFGPILGVIAHWFKKRKGLAIGCASFGSSLGGIVFPITARNLIPHVGFQWTMRILALIQLLTLVVMNLTLKRRLPPKENSGPFVNLRAFKLPAYSLYCLAGFVAFLGLSTLQIYIDISAVSIGISKDFSFYLVAIINAGSAFGRVAGGVLGDNIGSLNTLIPASLVAAAVTFAWPHATTSWDFIIIAIIYGLAWGVFSGLMWSPLIELGETHDVGLRMGMFMTVFACGALVGPPISGAINQHTGNYTDVGIYAGVVVIVSTCMLFSVRHLVLKRVWGKV